MDIKNELGVLLEIPSLSRVETNGNHTQKDGARPGMSSRDHESSATAHKKAQTMSDGILHDLSKFPN